jgi:hypothetical protein
LVGRQYLRAQDCCSRVLIEFVNLKRCCIYKRLCGKQCPELHDDRVEIDYGADLHLQDPENRKNAKKCGNRSLTATRSQEE